MIVQRGLYMYPFPSFSLIFLKIYILKCWLIVTDFARFEKHELFLV